MKSGHSEVFQKLRTAQSRRTFLSLLTASTGLIGFSGSSAGIDDSGVRNDTSLQDNSMDDRAKIPPYPEDPFMPGQFAGPFLFSTERSGWDVASIKEEYRTLLQLHLDVIDSAGLVTFRDGTVTSDPGSSIALSMSPHTGIPATSGRNTSIAANQEEDIQSIIDEMDWEYPGGASLESVSGSYAETFDGSKQTIEYTFTANGIPSAFSPVGLHLMDVAATNQFEQGYSGFFIDKIFLWEGLDFSEWATASFRDHIQSLSETRRNELGIEDPSTFDVKSYFQDNNLGPYNGKDPREDPVFQEYVIHNHLGVKRYIESLNERLTDQFPARFEQGNAALWANQFTGNLTGIQAVNVYISSHLDLINTELFPTVKPANDHKYKMLQAVGNFEKPVIAKGTLTSSFVDESELSPTDYHPNLERFQLAETHANGARLKIPLSPRSAYEADESITQWIRNDGSIPDTLQSFVDFTWTHKRFLTNSEPQNRVALVWSLPDRMFRRLPQWDISSNDSETGVESFNGAAKLLRENQIPYTVLVFGHPDLWDDTTQLERLSNYDAVILPDIQSLTDGQQLALDEYLSADGSLISSGSIPNKTGRYQERRDIDELFNRENAVVLEDNPALIRERDGEDTGTLSESLADAGISSVTGRQDSTLAVNIRGQSEHSRTIVHLLNYDYSKQNDSFEPKTDVTIEIPKPEHAVGVARYYSEQQTVDIDIETAESSLKFTVPKLTEWGFVVLSRKTSDLVNTEDAPAAEETVATLREEIQKAREAGYDWSPKFTVAETRLEEATTALDAEAYSRALEKAKDGVSTAENLNQERPVVGIDFAHGVTFNEDESGEGSAGGPLDPLQHNIAYPEYRIIESWSNDKLDELDILILPPALSFRGENYGFTADTRQAIIEFVEDGGSLVVLARGGVASDIDPLLSEFGYRFDGRGIKTGQDEKVVAPVVTAHELTVGVPEVNASLGTTITELPEDATTLAAMPEDNDAWFHEEQPLNERNENEVDVPPEPVYAVSNRGNGKVAVLGKWNYLTRAEPLDFWTPIMNNLIFTLSQNQVEGAKTVTETPSTTPTSHSTSEEHRTTKTEAGTSSNRETKTKSPGFGFEGGLAALIGGGALAKWLDKNTNSSEESQE